MITTLSLHRIWLNFSVSYYFSTVTNWYICILLVLLLLL